MGRSGERERETPPRREREQAREESNGRRGKTLHNALESGAREAASEQERQRERARKRAAVREGDSEAG